MHPAFVAAAPGNRRDASYAVSLLDKKIRARDIKSEAGKNTDLGVLRVVMATAKIELGLPSNPLERLPPFDTSQHPAYTFEEPNSLTVE